MADDIRPRSAAEEPDWEALGRSLAGESDPAEAARMRAYLASSPRDAALVAALDQALRATNVAPPSSAEIESALGRVMMRRASQPARHEIPDPAAWPAWWRPALPLRAAAVVLVVAGGLLVITFGRTRNVSRRVQDVAGGYGTPRTTAPGQLDSLRLPDGTRVVLGPLSSLTVDPRYGEAERAVTLSGEGYFDVAHGSEAHPFLVRTGIVELRDVGTTFSVRADTLSGVRVSVTSGAVATRSTARPASPTTVLRAGDRGLVGVDGTIRVERGAATAEDLAWTRGRLVFRDAPIDEVTLELRRWYGIDLLVTGPVLRGRRLTATFDRSNAPDVGRVIAAALGGVARQTGETLWVDPVHKGLPRR